MQDSESMEKRRIRCDRHLDVNFDVRLVAGRGERGHG
jgi:hypothetical protein